MAPGRPGLVEGVDHLLLLGQVGLQRDLGGGFGREVDPDHPGPGLAEALDAGRANPPAAPVMTQTLPSSIIRPAPRLPPGRRPSRQASTARATPISSPSRPGPAASCMPTGRPAESRPQGNERAGQRRALKGLVLRLSVVVRSGPLSGGAFSGTVGEARTSTSRQHLDGAAAAFLDSRASLEVLECRDVQAPFHVRADVVPEGRGIRLHEPSHRGERLGVEDRPQHVRVLVPAEIDLEQARAGTGETVQGRAEGLLDGGVESFAESPLEHPDAQAGERRGRVGRVEAPRRTSNIAAQSATERASGPTWSSVGQ